MSPYEEPIELLLASGSAEDRIAIREIAKNSILHPDSRRWAIGKYFPIASPQEIR